MERLTVTFLALAALAGSAMAQDSCRVLVWDNDAGEPAQGYTSVDMDTTERCYFTWADRRFDKWDVFVQRYHASVNIFDSTNILVNYDLNSAQSKVDPDIACDTAGNFVVAWQQVNSRLGYYDIYCRRFDKFGNPLQTDQTKVSKSQNTYTKDWPRVARNKTKYSTWYSAYFVIVWHEVRNVNHYIYAVLYDAAGNAITDTIQVNDNSSGNAKHPDVAFNDSLIVFTWADDRTGNYDIYARNYRSFTTSLAARGPSYKVNDDAGNMAQDYPAIAMACTTAQSRYWVIVWQDSRDHANNNNADIYSQQYDPWGQLYGYQREVTPSYILLLVSRRPSVSKGRNSFSFLVTWEDSSGYGRRIKARFNDTRNTLGTIHEANDSKEPPGKHYPSSCYWHDDVVVAFLDSSRAKCRGDIFGQNYRIIYDPIKGDTLEPRYSNYMVNSSDLIRANGRTGWYHYPDYDNPATAWDENPRPVGAPDSVEMPLDSTYVRAILSRNITPGRYYFRVVDTDTFQAGRKQKGNINEAEYDVCLMDLGYADATFSAGSITEAQQESLKAFSDAGGALLAIGNDFGEMYGGTSLFGQYFGADYLGPGNDATTGNIDSLVGMPDAFTKNMQFDYPYQKVEDNSVDVIAPLRTGCDTVFMSGGPAKWAYCRGISYAAYWKEPEAVDRRNVYFPFIMSALTSDGRHPNTTTELTRRILGFQGFNVEPEPIADLTADTSNTIEGTVVLRWTAVSDDSLAERASDYLLKIREYNPALPEAGKTTSEQEFVDSGLVYYQNWTPAAVGAAESKTIYLAPGKSYVFALKAGDESTPTRWSALGAEPMSQTRGDTLTYHYTYMGSTYGLGTVNPFSVSERLGVRVGDTLFITWSSSTISFGYARMNWLTAGDLFFYMDTKAGGADSTMTAWNGASVDTASAFDVAGDFKPDFCLAIDSLGSKCKLMYWNGTAWAESIGTYSPSNYSLDTINDTYTTVARVLRSKIGNPTSLKLLVLHLQENSDYCYRSFPIINPNGGKDAKWIPRYPYYYYFSSLSSGLSPRNAAQVLAVELAEFSALKAGSGVTLSWRTESETDNYQWLIDRSLEPDANYQRIATVPGQGTSPTGHAYQYADNAVLPGMTYYYMLGDQDFNENITWHGPVSVSTGGQAIDQISLGPCRPNPARGKMSIDYELPSACRASLSIYDICGRLVRTLADGDHQPGRHTVAWKGDSQDGPAVSSGVYFYRLEAGGTSLTRKITLIR